MTRATIEYTVDVDMDKIIDVVLGNKLPEVKIVPHTHLPLWRASMPKCGEFPMGIGWTPLEAMAELMKKLERWRQAAGKVT